MALADWEIIKGGGLTLDTKYKVSGSKSLTQGINAGETHIVHKQTYNDSPLNVRVDTWMTYEEPDAESVLYYIGCIARKQQDVNTYFYWFLLLELGIGDNPNSADFEWGYYSNGTKNKVGSSNVWQSMIDSGLGNWNAGTWRFIRMEGYQIGSGFTVKIAMTPNIASPDVNNPPVDSLVLIDSRTMNIPSELQNGGAVGIIVGNEAGSNSTGRPFLDYTQIWY